MNDVIEWLKTDEGITWWRDNFRPRGRCIAQILAQPSSYGDWSDAAYWPEDELGDDLI